jgi:hypothetical protein
MGLGGIDGDGDQAIRHGQALTSRGLRGREGFWDQEWDWALCVVALFGSL